MVEQEKEIFNYIIINPLFSKLDVEKLKRLTKYLRKIEVKQGFPIFREGDIESSLYFVAKGAVEVFKKPKSKEKRLRETGSQEKKGEIVGEIGIKEGGIKEKEIKLEGSDKDRIKGEEVKAEGIKVAEIRFGQSFGELSLIDAYPRSATVIAKTDCTLIVLDKENFMELEREEKEIAYHIVRQMVTLISRRLRETTDKLTEFLISSSEELP